jgi:hypothetical protein
VNVVEVLKTIENRDGTKTMVVWEDVDVSTTCTTAAGVGTVHGGLALERRPDGKGGTVISKDHGSQTKAYLTGGQWANKKVQLWAQAHFSSNFHDQDHPENGLKMDLVEDFKFKTLLCFLSEVPTDKNVDRMLGDPTQPNTWAGVISSHMGIGSVPMLKTALVDNGKQFGGFGFFLDHPKPAKLTDPWKNFVMIDPSVGAGNVGAFQDVQDAGGSVLVDLWHRHTMDGGGLWDAKEPDQPRGDSHSGGCESDGLEDDAPAAEDDAPVAEDDGN